MQYKKIFFPIGAGDDVKERIKGALLVAKYFSGHIEILACQLDPSVVYNMKMTLRGGVLYEEFLKAATTLFGSGWAWLVYNPKEDKLQIMQTSNAQTPVTDGLVPLLVADVWEHAYYVDHRNARPAYLEKLFENINWDFVSSAYEWALKERLNSVKFYVSELHGGAKSCCGCGCN